MSKELLFSPLGMTSTSTSHADFLSAPNHAVLHARIAEDDFQPLFDRDPDAEAPAGGVSSNVRDLATWMQLLLSDGSRDGSAFINSDPLNQALSAQIVSSHAGDLDQRPGHYGFGINVGSAAGGASRSAIPARSASARPPPPLSYPTSTSASSS
jgi:CubicO group peptidase (beta-lactamase class C family)